ncbi:MAG: ubiquinone/menaquinone biosynthesis methyltransferase [Planctomycetota bacterium]|jgi:demethylmenaquinone methyltransferase/2-methoxy-6-polyprenyl-1,4-benzoquinol methylase
MPDPIQVRAMFGRIAGRYDLLNRVLTLGIDRSWRRRVVRRADEQLGSGGAAAGTAAQAVAAARILDVCCGSGDLTLDFDRAGAAAVGLDFTPELLERAVAKADAKADNKEKAVPFLHGDALDLPFAGAHFDASSVAFGLRNVADRRRCLREMSRVVRPGGWVYVLEFQVPKGFLGWCYRLYFERLLPWIGGLVSRDDSAYVYLRDTVLAWPEAETLCEEFAEEGLVECGFERMTFGILALHWGRVPAPAVPTA